MSKRRLTAAQRGALLALPVDGSWSGRLGRLTKAVMSIEAMHPGLVEASIMRGYGGVSYRQARLTKQGQAERAQIEAAGVGAIDPNGGGPGVRLRENPA